MTRVASYLVIVNPASGKGRGLARAEALRSTLASSHRVEVVTTRRRGFAADVAAERAASFDRVIAVGGDGTLNEVLSGLMRAGENAGERPALGFLPSGTANAAVLAFGFSASPTAVARSLPEVEIRAVDVGVVTHAGTERPFLLWFGAGYDAVVIDALNSKRTGLMGIAGLARKAPDVLLAVRRYPSPDIDVHMDARASDHAASVIVANVGQVAFGGTVAEGVDPFDGRLDVVMVPRATTLSLVALCGRMMLSSLAQARSVTRTTGTAARLTSGGCVPFQLDGEPVGTLPAEIRLEPRAVRLLLT